MIAEDIIRKAKELEQTEVGKKVRPLFSLAYEKSIEISEKLQADTDIVKLGMLFMDIKLKQAMSEDRIEEHVKMSSDFAKKFLEKTDLTSEDKEKIINCVEAHHKAIPFICQEAEICANADCYKFIHPKGFLQYLCILNERHDDLNLALDNAKNKLDEKKNILSLDLCKEELLPYFDMIEKIIEKAKNE